VATTRGLSYVEGYDIRAELTRVFGFGRWSEETLDQQLICENETQTSQGKKAWYVVYRTRVRLYVCAPDGTPVCNYDGAHVGESTHPVRGEAHGNALTNSQTYALRRCAINLGDQFGLSLYNKGSQEAIVRWTLIRPETSENITTDTDNVPVINPEAAESDAGEAASEAPKATRQRKPAPPPETLTLEQLITRIAEATTVDQLRAAWMIAGTSGLLPSEIILSGTDETITVQDYLYRRNDQLVLPKSDSGTGDVPGESAGAE
jgi:recombination DNA repair RAD52 pathway protein